MTRTVETTARQALAGTRLATGGKTACTDCDRPIREGDKVGVYATREQGADDFETPRVYCRSCRQETIRHPTLGARELLAFGRLAMTTDRTTRTAHATLRTPELVAHSPADEGVDA